MIACSMVPIVAGRGGIHNCVPMRASSSAAHLARSAGGASSRGGAGVPGAYRGGANVKRRELYGDRWQGVLSPVEAGGRPREVGLFGGRSHLGLHPGDQLLDRLRVVERQCPARELLAL